MSSETPALATGKARMMATRWATLALPDKNPTTSSAPTCSNMSIKYFGARSQSWLSAFKNTASIQWSVAERVKAWGCQLSRAFSAPPWLRGVRRESAKPLACAKVSKNA